MAASSTAWRWFVRCGIGKSSQTRHIASGVLPPSALPPSGGTGLSIEIGMARSCLSSRATVLSARTAPPPTTAPLQCSTNFYDIREDRRPGDGIGNNAGVNAITAAPEDAGMLRVAAEELHRRRIGSGRRPRIDVIRARCPPPTCGCRLPLVLSDEGAGRRCDSRWAVRTGPRRYLRRRASRRERCSGARRRCRRERSGPPSSDRSG